MTWPTTLQDQLPLLLVLSPLIGFFVTWGANRFEPGLVRPLAISNLACTLVVLGGMEWQLEADLAANTMAIRQAKQESSAISQDFDPTAEVYRKLARQRTARLAHHGFVMDGFNLFAVLTLVLITHGVIWQTDASQVGERQWIPMLMLFESTASGLLLAHDIRVFLFLLTVSVILMSLLIGLCGGAMRRQHAVRFLLAQFCGGGLIAMGLAMLVVAVPWMQIPDSTTLPAVSYDLASLVQEIQKWGPRNELSYQYQSEVFPWLMLLMSAGFAIQSGLFPFHAWQVRLLSDLPPLIAILFLVGSSTACSVGWFRFVLPLAPEMLAPFDRWLLIPAFLGAIWGAVRGMALVGDDRQWRERAAFILMSLKGISLMGAYTFTRAGMMGSWLMQQQVAIYAVVMFIAIGSSRLQFQEASQAITVRPPLLGRTGWLLFGLALFGLFGSGFLQISELFFQSLSLTAAVFLIGLSLIAIGIRPQFEQLSGRGPVGHEPAAKSPLSGLLILGFSVAIVVSLFPAWLIHQSDPEFARVFRRFESTAMADSAESDSGER